MFSLGAKLRNPHDERCEVSAALVRKNCLLNFERPPKTKRSSWRYEHQNADAIRIAIERRPQRLAAWSNVVKTSGCHCVRATTQREAGKCHNERSAAHVRYSFIRP